MIIRNANLDDAEGIATVHVAYWQKIYRGIVPDSILDNLSINEREHQWHDLINQNINIMVIEKDNVIVGFASICAARDGPIVKLRTMGRQMYNIQITHYDPFLLSNLVV